MATDITILPNIVSTEKDTDSSKFNMLESSLKRLKNISFIKKDKETKLPKLFRIGSKRTLADRIDETNELVEKDVKAKESHEDSMSSFLDLLTSPIGIILEGFATIWAGGWVIDNMFGSDTLKPFGDLLFPSGKVSKEVVGYGESGSSTDAMKFFQKKGWTKEQSAGIVGNLQTESGKDMKTNASGDPNKFGVNQAYGIAQWHPDRQEMFKKVFNKDIRESTFMEQLEFVNWELNNTYKSAGKALKQTKDASKAAEIVDTLYEIPSKTETGKHEQRKANALSLVSQKQEEPSNVNIDDVLQFTARTGDISHFNRLQSSFKAKIIKLAESYKKETGKKLTINSAFRTPEEQIGASRAKRGKHMIGEAVDVPISCASVLSKYMKSLGIDGQIHYEPIHYHIQTFGNLQNVTKATKEPKKTKQKETAKPKKDQSKQKKLVNDKNIQYNHNLIPSETSLELYKSDTPISFSTTQSIKSKSLNIININENVKIYPK